MKTPLARKPFIYLTVPAVLLAACSASYAASAQSAPAPAQHTHQLFIGLDILANTSRGLGRVQKVEPGAIEVTIDNARRRIPVTEMQGYRVRHETRVSSTIVQISQAETARRSGRLDDTMREVIVEQAIEEKESKRLETIERQEYVDNLSEEHPNDADDIAVEHERRELVRTIREENPNSQENLFGGAFIAYEDAMNAANAMGASDEFRFSFTLSAPEEIPNSHVAILAVVSDPAMPSVSSQRVILRALNPIGPQPTLIRITQDGFPPGHELSSYSIHIFANGRELGTNMAVGSVGMTRDEAVQFLRLRHQAAHAKTNIDARPMADFVPADFVRHVPGGQHGRRVTVRVGPDGRVLNATLERAGRGDGDALLETMIRQTAFFPAMREGAPVEQEATVTLADFLP